MYGLKVILSVEVAIHTHRMKAFQETHDTQALGEALNLLPMVKRDAYIKEEIATTKMACFYSRKVKERPLKEGDLILRKMKANRRGVIQGKLTRNWEMPYIIAEEVRSGTFCL